MVDLNDELVNIITTQFPEFPIQNLETVGDKNIESTGKIQSSGKDKWSRDSTLTLINLRKQYDNLFKSTTIKNDSVWQIIRDIMPGDYSRAQIKDRWQYLRKRYIKKKENMSERSSGAETITFDYYNEMEDFLGKKANITPLAIASSIKGAEACGSVELNTSDVLEDEVPRKKSKTDNREQKDQIKTKKADTIYTFLKDYRTECVKKEEAKERRHRESLDVRNRAIDIFAQKMDSLLEKL